MEQNVPNILNEKQTNKQHATFEFYSIQLGLILGVPIKGFCCSITQRVSKSWVIHHFSTFILIQEKENIKS